MGGGVGIYFHRVSCCGFEIMNTRATDKHFVSGHSIGDAAIKKFYMSSGKKSTPCSWFLRGWGGCVRINFHRVSCCGFEITNTSANDNNFVPGHSSADDEISNKKKFKYRHTNL